MQPALFLDRDGTLIVEKNYLAKINDIELIGDIGTTLQKIKEKGYLLLVITNQSAVAKGMITEDFIKKSFQRINQLLLPFSVQIDDCFYCPHLAKENCNCRKPNTGMIEKAKKKYQIDIKNSWVVGDKAIDIELAENIRCNAALVPTGYGKEEKKKILNPEVKILQKFSNILQWL